MSQEKPLYSRFMNLPDENVAWDSALSCLIQAPLENTTTFQHGTAAAPQALLRASEQLEAYDFSNGRDLSELAVCTLAAPKLLGLGTREALTLIEEQVNKALAAHKWPLVVGGEQTVSLASLRALVKQHPNLCVVQFDSHYDLHDSFNGSAHSHRCTLRRVLEMGLKVLHVGARAASRDEAEFALSSTGRLSSISAEELIANPSAFSTKLKDLGPHIYLSIDLSILDPRECPGVSNPEPGGLSWKLLQQQLEVLFESKETVGADICELSPLAGDARSELIAAKLALKLFDLHQTGTTP